MLNPDSIDYIDSLDEELQEIKQGLVITSYKTDTSGDLTEVSTSYPVKGNKLVTEELVRRGWKKGLKKKQRTDGRHCTRNQYEGYIMVQHMSKDV